MRALSRRPADLAMIDLRMPDVNGLELLRQIRTTVPELRGDSDDGVRRGRQRGRGDQAGRARLPDQAVRLRSVASGAGRHPRRARAAGASGRASRAQVARQLEFCGMLGRSPAMQEVFSLIQRLAPHAKVVLRHGRDRHGQRTGGARVPSGRPAPRRARSSRSTARRSSRRSSRASCSVMCAARSPERVGTQAGPVRGGRQRHAVSRRVGELPLARAGEAAARARDGEVQRVGALQPKRSTSRDRRDEPRSRGRGRRRPLPGDLFYRLNVVESRCRRCASAAKTFRT